jgi:hypothetical protein
MAFLVSRVTGTPPKLQLQAKRIPASGRSGASTHGTGGTSDSAPSGPEMIFRIRDKSSIERASGPKTFMWRTARGRPGGSGM